MRFKYGKPNVDLQFIMDDLKFTSQAEAISFCESLLKTGFLGKNGTKNYFISNIYRYALKIN